MAELTYRMWEEENELVVRGITSAQQVLDICAEHGNTGQHEFNMEGDLRILPSDYIGKQLCDDGITVVFYAIDGPTAAKVVEEMF